MPTRPPPPFLNNKILQQICSNSKQIIMRVLYTLDTYALYNKMNGDLRSKLFSKKAGWSKGGFKPSSEENIL